MTTPRLELPRVEMVAISSTQIALTQRALRRSMQGIRFASVKLLTDAPLVSHDGIEIVPIAPLRSSQDYSRFLLARLADYVEADFVLIVQWDGYVINPSAWTDTFLLYDYIGARWPHFSDEYVVGNGGFSLRSAKLIKACQSATIAGEAAEDILICRENRRVLEQHHGLTFAPSALADNFAFERAPPKLPCFGFHGFFNIPRVEGLDSFATFYAQADPHRIGSRELGDCLRRLLFRIQPRYLPLIWRMTLDWLLARHVRGQHNS